MKKAIVVENLHKSYGKAQILKGLSLTVYEGETLVILGRSGVGKSVLLKQIIGIETPNKGEIIVNDTPLCKNGMRVKNAPLINMGMLFQGAALFDSLTVGENTAFYLRQHDNEISEEEIQEKVSKALDMVGLSNTQKKMPSDLSGGMRKRAALARLIVYRPQILLYDEPTTGLDPITAMQINDLINQTKKELQATSIVVTHDMRSAMEVGDRMAFHHDGKIHLIADKQTFFKSQDPLLQAFFTNAEVALKQER